MYEPGKRGHLFIINPKSFPRKGELQDFVARLEGYFRSNRIPGLLYHVSRYPRDAISVVRKYLGLAGQDTTVRVYAAGGDGITFDCLNGLVGMPNAELAIMPFGGGSDFVRAFGEEYYGRFRDVALQVSAPAIPTDIIHCGNNYALNFCTVGQESAAVIRTTPLSKRFERIRFMFPGLASLFYTLGGIAAVFDKSLCGQRYEIQADGLDYSGRYNAINVANGPCYGSGKSPVATAVPDDGFLDMLVTRKLGSLKTLGIMPGYLRGKYYKYPKTCFLRRVKKITIRSESPLLVNMDGETFFDSRVTIELIPRAIKIAAVDNLAYRRRAEFRET
jgi:diacylglycerol kinase family enzyme